MKATITPIHAGDNGACVATMADVNDAAYRVAHHDGRVTQNERRRVAAQVAEAVQALCSVMRVL